MSDSDSSSHPTRRPISPGSSDDSTRTVQGEQEQAIPAADTQPTVISQGSPIPLLPRGSSSGSAQPEPVDADTIAPGTRLGDIELEEFVGGGGMGRVYRGRDTRLGRTVAVKVLNQNQMANKESAQRFLNEAQTAARLNHHHVAQVYSAGESNGLPFIVFEFIEGTNIRSLVDQKGPLPLAEALSYVLQIADAVSHAAEHHIVHRDIKPSNVLIEAHGKAKLIDMGLARINEPDTSRTDLTASGVTLGTFDYISPEQARDPRNTDVRSDIYSLGCTFFYMLAGRPPFPEGTVLQKLLRHQGDEPPDICQFRPDLPEEVGRVLGRMMAKNSQRRYQDAARLIEALLSLADLIGLRPTGPGRTVWLPPRQTTVSAVQRHLPWLAPVMAMAAMLLALNFFWSGKEHPEWVSTNAPATSAGPAGAGKPATAAQIDELGPNGAASGGLTANVPTGITATAMPEDAASPIEIPPARPTKVADLSAARAELPNPPADVLIVAAEPDGPNQFSSLTAALEADTRTGVIELRFDGRHEAKPIRLTDRDVTLRAGDGFEPVIVFRPREIDPVIYPREMVELVGSKLILQGVALELDVPRDLPSESWSLVAAGDASRMELVESSLTIRNAAQGQQAYHGQVAFFLVRSPRDARLAADPEAAATALPFELQLKDSVVRGEAPFLRVESGRTVRVDWDNGLLATSEYFLVVDAAARPPNVAEEHQFNLTHVTAATGKGFCRFEFNPHELHPCPTRFELASNVISTGGSPLLTLAGATDVWASLKLISWTGRKSLASSGAKVVDIIAPETATETDLLLLGELVDRWQQQADGLPSREALPWLHGPSRQRPYHTHTPKDYLLDPEAFSSLASSGDDAGQTPGMLVRRMPSLPAEPEPSGGPGS